MATISKDVIKCCACFKSPRYSQSLTDQIGNSNNRKSYGEILHHLLKLNSHYEGDCYLISQQICNKCASVLKSVYAFIVTALRKYNNHFQIMCEDNCVKEEDIDLPLLPEIEAQVKIESKYSESSYDASDNEKFQSKLHSSFCEVKDEDSHSNEMDKLCKAETLSGNCDVTNYSKNSDSDEWLTDEGVEFTANETNDDKEFSTLPNSLPRRCDICDKVYNNAEALRKHKKYTHMPDERKISCPLCSYKSSRKHNLKVHLRTVHARDSVSKFITAPGTQEILSCTMCTKKYTKKNSLQKHLKRVHRNDKHSQHKRKKPLKQKTNMEVGNKYLCTFCGKSLSTKYHLKDHVRLHTGEKPYKCDFCPKTFTRMADVKLHCVIHSDEKPHQCTQCNKSFKRSDKLRVHMRVHSELRPYKCPECEKTFKYSNVMRTHMLIHTGHRPFECATCGETFSLRTSLNIHCTKNNHVQAKE